MIQGGNHITLAVRDVARSFTFYKDLLGLRPLARWEHGAYLLAGELWLCLSQDDATRDGPLPEYTHLAFTLLPGDFEAWRRRLEAAAVTLWRQNRSEGDSLYFLDPDGHKLELHVGDWRSRLAACRQAPYAGMEFFDAGDAVAGALPSGESEGE